MKKRFLSIILCLCLVVGVFPISVLASATYSVTYDANGGTISGGTTYTVGGIAAGKIAITNLTPSWKNYEFLGWSQKKDATMPEYLAQGGNGTKKEFTLSKDIVLYAVWQPKVVDIEIYKPVTKIYVGETETLDTKITTKANTQSDALVSWTSSDPSVLLIEKYTGQLIPIKKGTVTITAAAGRDNPKSDSCEITVKDDKDVDINIDRRGMSMTIGETDDVPDDDLEWISIDPDVAVIDGDEVIANGAGKTAIVAFDGEDDIEVCWVEVYATLTLNANGGSFGRSKIYELETNEGQIDLSYKYVPERSGYNFSGWSKTATAKVADYKKNETIYLSSDSELFAVWQKEVKEFWKDDTDTDWYDKDEDVFYISAPEELAGLAELVNDGENFDDCTIYLQADIDLCGEKNKGHWTAIGTKETPFCGEFDGCGYTISGLYVSETVSQKDCYVGLFGYLDDAGIRNLGVDGFVSGSKSADKTSSESSKSSGYFGGLAGYASDCLIENCWNTVSVEGVDYIGGFLGFAEELKIENCWFAGETEQSNSSDYIGAFIGYAENSETGSCYYQKGSSYSAVGKSDKNSDFSDVEEYKKADLCSEDFVEILNDWVEDQDDDSYILWDISDATSDSGYPDFIKSVLWTGVIDTDWYDKSQVTFTITTAEELAGLAELVNDGTTFKGKEILLGADITIGYHHNWTPIGNYDDSFCGIFDGRGYEIKSIQVVDNRGEEIGLFGVVEDAMICNLGVSDCKFKQTDDDGTAGSVVGLATDSSIINCWSVSECETEGIGGGIVGEIDGSNVYNCWFVGSVSGDVEGAIAGKAKNKANIANCYYLSRSAHEICEETSKDSSVSGEAMTNKEMLSDDFVDSLNEWVKKQNSEQYFSWKKQTNNYPCFSSLLVTVVSISLDSTTLRLNAGESKTLKATVQPENATYSDITWTSSNEKSVTVKDGVITAIADGEAEITAAIGEKTAICRVVVGSGGIVSADNSCYKTCFIAEKSSKFIDLSGKQEISAAEALAVCTELGFTADCSFSFTDQDMLTRETACELICKQVIKNQNPEIAKDISFDDIDSNRWSNNYISYLVKEGIINGVTTKLFMPNTLISGTAFCEVLLASVGWLHLEGKDSISIPETLANATYCISLDENIVDPEVIVDSEYALNRLLLNGCVKAGIDVQVELLDDLKIIIFLDKYIGNDETVVLTASNIISQYEKTAASAAYAVTGLENGAVTKIICSVEDFDVGDSANVVYYGSSGKYSSKSVSIEDRNQVVFTVKVFGQFIIIPKDQYKASDWDPMKNFVKNVVYNGFSDVSESAWYGEEGQGVVKSAVQLGIMNGDVSGTFRPTDNIKIGEAIKMAAVVRNIYQGNQESFTKSRLEDHWAQPYADFCIEQGMFNENEFSNFEAYATRAQMAFIFSKALPSFESINNVTYSDIPDVTSSTNYAEQILSLYCAGVLTGDAGDHSFRPNENINRAEAAAIIARVALISERVNMSF